MLGLIVFFEKKKKRTTRSSAGPSKFVLGYEACGIRKQFTVQIQIFRLLFSSASLPLFFFFYSFDSRRSMMLTKLSGTDVSFKCDVLGLEAMEF